MDSCRYEQASPLRYSMPLLFFAPVLLIPLSASDMAYDIPKDLPFPRANKSFAEHSGVSLRSKVSESHPPRFPANMRKLLYYLPLQDFLTRESFRLKKSCSRRVSPYTQAPSLPFPRSRESVKSLAGESIIKFFILLTLPFYLFVSGLRFLHFSDTNHTLYENCIEN